MNKIKISILSALLLTGWMSSACEGPAGPEGSRGEQGNTNIMYSGWMNIEWAANSTDVNKEMAIHEPGITTDFLNDGGVVLMFLKIQGESSTLVYSLPVLNATGQFHFGFVAIDSEVALGGDGLQGIVLWLRSLDGHTPVPDELWMNLETRYVLIPGDNQIAAKGIDTADYKQISDLFDIPD